MKEIVCDSRTLPHSIDIRGLAIADVICALANIRTPTEKQSASRPHDQMLFSPEYLQGRVEYALRALRDRYDEQSLPQCERFLSDLGIPVRFDAEAGLDPSEFDSRNGENSALAAVEYLRSTNSYDTRHLQLERCSGGRRTSFTEVQLPLSNENSALHCHWSGRCAEFRCQRISTKEALGLLFALLRAHNAKGAFALDQLSPAIPERAFTFVPEECHALGIHDPSEAMIARAIREEFEVDLDTLGTEFRIVNVDRAFAGDLCCLAELHVENNRAQTQRFILGTVMVIHMLSLLLILMAAPTLQVPFITTTSSGFRAALCLWLLTIWAPIRLGYRWYRRTH